MISKTSCIRPIEIVVTVNAVINSSSLILAFAVAVMMTNNFIIVTVIAFIVSFN